MKKTILIVMCAFLTLSVFTSCGKTMSNNTSTSLTEIQDIVRQSQKDYESGNMKSANSQIDKLIKISQDTMYTENERLISKYCAVYINSGFTLNYLIKNDTDWVNSQDLSEFNILYERMFKEIINGGVTNNETLDQYINGLVNCTNPIIKRYRELKGI